MATQKGNRLAWGLSLLVFGILFLVKELHFIPTEISNVIFDYRNFPFIMGIIFLFAHSNKTIGIVLVIVGLLLYLPNIIQWSQHISAFIWPALLIIAGVVLVFGVKRKK
jgi:hypothetical protein